MKKVEFTIPGPPRGKERPRFNMKTGTTFTPKTTVEYERLVRNSYLRESHYMATKEQPMAIYVTAFYEIPKSESKVKRERKALNYVKPTKKPDIDNILKVVMDGLTGVAYVDDKQVVDAQIKKRYSVEPRVEVTIIEVAE